MDLIAILAKTLIGLVAVIHIYFFWLEMFAWTTRGPKVFDKIPRTVFEQSKTVAANQGVYNGFLAAGLVWSLLIVDHAWSNNIATFFLVCIIIAGVYGALSVDRKIFFVQSLPACLALGLLIL